MQKKCNNGKKNFRPVKTFFNITKNGSDAANFDAHYKFLIRKVFVVFFELFNFKNKKKEVSKKF